MDWRIINTSLCSNWWNWIYSDISGYNQKSPAFYGIYKVSVECQSHTGHKATYTLYVKVQQDNVTYIYFDNGGYIHSGYNNSGYTWRGGGIQWNVDWSGNIINGKAVIHVNYDYGGYQLFTIHF